MFTLSAISLKEKFLNNEISATEITKVLGAPNIISKDKQGRETWTYDRISRESEAKSMTFFWDYKPHQLVYRCGNG